MMRPRLIWRGVVLLLGLCTSLAAPSAQTAIAAGPRAAVVVGNASYDFGPLANPLNDARAMAGVLSELGFEVHLVENASKGELRQMLEVMRTRFAPGGLGLFYYAGHAVQYRGVNYLLPTDLSIEAAKADLPGSSLAIGTVLQTMEDAGFDVNVVILDSCRDYPFAANDQAFGEGLADIATGGETLVAYATAAGQVALDGTGPNSPYTAALVSALDLPGHDLYDVFRIVRGKVREATNGRQLPWISGSIESHIVLRDQDLGPEPVRVADVSPDQVLWNTIRNSADPADFDRFTRLHPNSPQVGQALQRRNELRATGAEEIAPLLVAAEAVQGPRGRTVEISACDIWASDPFDPRRIADGVEWGLVNTRAAIRDCAAAVAAQPDNPRLNFNLARALDVAERFAEAEGFYRRAAEQSYAAALKNLGYMHRTGRGMPRDFETAAELYYLAALQGSPSARNALGKLYELGWGVPASLEESVRWTRLAADDGFAPAMDYLGNAYRDGQGVETDPRQAFEHYQAAATFGNSNAMTNLARAYLEGLGTAPDAGQALHWYQRATEEGNPYAPHHLARLYREGKLVPQDTRRALALFELAADRGNEWAYWQIASMYEGGELGAPDPARAYYHYWLARAAGEERRNKDAEQLAASANDKLDQLRPRLDPATAIAMETRAETWIDQNSLHRFTLISGY